MGPCPSCAAPLEENQEVLFCPACRCSLHERSNLAAAFGVSLDESALDIEVDRLAEPLGTCPGCQRGNLLAGRLAGERVAQCATCGALWLGGPALARVRATFTRQGAAYDPIA